MKFKKGDIVVVVRLNNDAGTARREYLFRTYTVTEVMDSVYTHPYMLDVSDKFSFGENELEHEHIYNSPLYKALS